MAFLGLLLLIQTKAVKAPILSDPAFVQLKNLVGGHWLSEENGLKIDNRFQFAVNGLMIKGDGHVTYKGKTVLTTQPNMGWDPSTKTVYYIDFHNHDAVMSGHITLKDGWLNFDFGEITNPKAHYFGRASFPNKDTYVFELPSEKETMTLHRAP